MQALKIVCHDGSEFVCGSYDELTAFMYNYRRANAERIRKEFPKARGIVERVDIIEMSEEEYHSIPASSESALYFNGIDVTDPA